MYAGPDVPKLWLFDGQQARFYQLTGWQYTEVSNSLQFPFLPSEVITTHLQLGRTSDIIKMRKAFRAWV